MDKKRTLHISLGLILWLAGPGLVWAQGKFPTRPISVIHHSAPGGGSTINTQTLQPQFEKSIGAPMLVVSKPGGGGIIAWNYIANSPPDGYTVGLINPSHLLAPYVTKGGSKYPFDPIILTVKVPAGIIVRADSPWKTLREFADYAKANPGKVQMGNSGHGTMYHIGNIGIEMALGVKFTHVPYKGSGPCITALMGGHIDGSLVEISTALPYVEANKLRTLAVSSAKRSFVLPNVPTFKETGFDLDVGTWYGYAVPRGTPTDRVKILHDAFKAAMNSDEFKNFYRKQGGDLDYLGPEGFAAFLVDQHNLWKKIIDFSGFKPID